eukprot:GHVQ01017503.1.p1 GENE.GHVQ01017503.1~~GHVQ01017503.1.p1  ORF type:complete len:440 (+),score=72.39 GHVQ01017503.1:174-1322(+)
MHVLCTGGAGYIGSHTVVHLVAKGYRVTVLDNLSNTSQEVIVRLREITNTSETTLRFVKMDMRDTEALNKLFVDQQFYAVIHYAGLKAVGESVAKPLEYYENNVTGTLCLLQAMRLSGCKVLVFSSSATVYRPSDSLVNEGSAIGASNPYGHCKVMLEQILQDISASDPSMKFSLLRYFNPVGAHSSGRIGESPAHPQNLLPYITQVAVGRKEMLNVFGDDWGTTDGTGVRDYIHVEDLAEGHIAALNKLINLSQGCCLIHNLGTGRGVSVLELKALMENACGKKLKHKVVSRRPGDLGCVVADATKAERDLGWKAKRTIEEACASSWKWQSTNPYGYENPEDGARREERENHSTNGCIDKTLNKPNNHKVGSEGGTNGSLV